MKDKCCIRCKFLDKDGKKCPLAMQQVKKHGTISICEFKCNGFELAEELKL
jgi:hypothetical protein